MPDGTQVQGPDGNTYQFPEGTTKDAAIAYFKKKGIGVQAAPQAATPAESNAPDVGPAIIPTASGGSPGDWLQSIVNPGNSQTRSALENARPGMVKQGAVALGTELSGGLLGAGGGILGFLGRVLTRGAGAGAGSVVGQALTGEDPLASEQLKETGKIAAFTSAFAAPLEAISGLAGTKLGRGAINASMGSTARDMTYANPARGLLREDIQDIATGSWDKYQDALRAGKTPTEAAQAAGGRFASVSQRINELTPRLGQLLNGSPAQIPVANVIDKPLNDAAQGIMDNPSMTHLEKLNAITKLFDLQDSLKSGLGAQATPAQLQVIKQAIGNRVNWGGTSAVTDDVKDAYRAVYGSLKEAIHRSVPGTAEIDNRLTDLLGASSDLVSQAKAEEAGKIPFSAVRLGQKEIGRILPSATSAPDVVPAGAAIGEQLLSKGKKLPQAQPNTPGLPFHPGAGL